MSGTADILRESGFGDFEILEGGLPEYVEDTVAECRKLCEQNLCGDYGRTWACPPGYGEHMDSLSSRYGRALVMKRTYMVDPGDRERASEVGAEMQESVRRAVTALRSKGVDCRGFADGGCRYCGVCSYPEPCRYPEMLVPSISALGVDIGAYLRGLGEDFGFRDDRMTLYGLILVP